MDYGSPRLVASKPERILSLSLFIDDVLARNPSLDAAWAAWRAASARYPQVVSLDDPMLDLMMAPGSIGSNDVDFGYVIQGRQKIPWSGKRQLRGVAASHEAQALRFDATQARVALVLAAKDAYFEYFLASKSLILNTSNRAALDDFRRSALKRYESNLVTRQDVLLADVELALSDRRRLELQRMQRVAVARINTLLLREPSATLPSAPSELPPASAPYDAEALHALALSQRPDLASAVSRWRAEQAGIAVAQREYKPDLELVGRYDTFWQAPQEQLQGQVGVTLNVPLAQQKRHAAVREATARAAQRRAEIQNLHTQVRFEVQEAYERVRESQAAVELFATQLLPAARASVESAVAAYVSGSVDFLRLIEAQRQLIALQQGETEALTEYHRRWATMERATGGPLILPTVEELPRQGVHPPAR